MIQRAFFFDIDGTIAVHNNPPSGEDTAAIRALRQQGHRVFICTGRVISTLYPAIHEVGFDGYVLGAGSHILVGDTVVYKAVMGDELLQRVIRYCLTHHLSVILEGERSLYSINPSKSYEKTFPHVTTDTAFMAGGAYKDAINKFSIWGQVSDDMRAMLGKDMDVIQHPDVAEVVLSGCCKSDGMRRVLEHIGIARENSVAFGDSHNDIDMLAYAGFGIALGGAHSEVLAAADYVTAPLEENGVAKAIRTLFLAE